MQGNCQKENQIFLIIDSYYELHSGRQSIRNPVSFGFGQCSRVAIEMKEIVNLR